MKPRIWIPLGCLGIFMATFAWGYSYLRSPSGSRWLLSKVQAELAQSGQARLEFSEAVIDPFGLIRFKDLKLKQGEGVDVSIPLFEARYRISFLSRKVEIDRLSVERPRILFHSEAKAETPPLSGGAGEGLALFEKALASLPVQVALKEMEISHLSLDLDFKLPQAHLRFEADASAKFRVEALLDGPDLKMRIHPSEVHLGIHGLKLNGKDLELGLARVSVDSVMETELAAKRKELSRLDPAAFKKLIRKLELKGGMKLSEGSLALPARRVRFRSQEISWAGNPAQMELHSKTLGLFSAPDSRVEADLQGDLNLRLDSESGEISGKGRLRLAELDLLDSAWTAKLADRLTLQGKARMHAPVALSRFFKSADGLKRIGNLTGEFHWDGALTPREKAPPDLSARVQGSLDPIRVPALEKPLRTGFTSEILWNPEKRAGSVKGALKLESQGQWKVAPDFDARLDLGGGALSLDISAGIPFAELPRLARVEELRMSARVHSPDFAAQQDWDYRFSVTQKNLTLARELAGQVVSFPDFRMEGAGTVEDADDFSLDQLKASLSGPNGAPLLQLQTEASGSLKTRNFDNSGTLELLLSKDLGRAFTRLADQQVFGKISFPWDLVLRRGREIRFDGELQAADLSWAKGPIRVEGVSGSAPVSEKLIWDGKRIQFASLINLNPFERVDFERFRPLVERSDRMQIERIGFEEKTYGPMNGFFSVRQNMVFANQVSFRLGSGEAAGEMYFNAHPANLQFGVLSRLTGLELTEVLPKKMLAQAPDGDKRISGRSNLVMNFNRASLDGRLDVTEIGGGQLVTLINILDPKYENEQMNQARTLLGIAYPTQVEMAFQKSFMDMGIQLGGLINQKIFLRGIPLSGWITGATAQVVKKTEGGLLK